MVEGDGCHRVAAAHRKSLVGRKFKASSPNGRFKAGARAIDTAGGVLLRIEVHGKNLFYFFGKSGKAATLVVHIHFGMAGAFAVYKGEEPETTPNTRLRLEVAGGTKQLVAHLSAMTVEHGQPTVLYERLAQKLGPDPLRADATPEGFVARCAETKKPIGGVLMDQSFIAGVGNIYRTETLYEAGIHPSQLANTLSPKELLGLWRVIVTQMQAGFKTGSIWGNRDCPLCYGQSKSACGGKVKDWEMGGRTVYACVKRQVLDTKRVPIAVDTSLVRAGTLQLGEMVPAAVAEDRKRRTGEGLAMQHVALKDDATRAGALAASVGKRQKGASKKKPAATQSLRKRPAASLQSSSTAKRRRTAASGGA